jgi:hypothetical protein
VYTLFLLGISSKGTLKRPKYRWEDNIKINHREEGFEGVD